MWFDVYLAHILFLKYPELEKELETIPSDQLQMSFSSEDKKSFQRTIDQMLMSPSQSLKRSNNTGLVIFLYQTFQTQFHLWDYKNYPKHSVPPKNPVLLELKNYLLEDSKLEEVRCISGGIVIMLFCDVDDYTHSDSDESVSITNLAIQFEGVPEIAYNHLKLLNGGYTVSLFRAQERTENLLGAYLEVSSNHSAYFTFTSAQIQNYVP